MADFRIAAAQVPSVRGDLATNVATHAATIAAAAGHGVRVLVFPELSRVAGIRLLEPIAYHDLIEVMRRSVLVLTDSGGIQEEAPALRKPVLILRSVTERPEVLESGFGELVGSDRDLIADEVHRLLSDPAAYAAMTTGINPFGDGRAAERIVETIEERCRSGRLFASPNMEAPVPQH